jgi:hypothetical protein
MKQMLDQQFYDQWVNVSLTDVRLHFLTLGANGGSKCLLMGNWGVN